jgi:uncharacterized membrane protein
MTKLALALRLALAALFITAGVAHFTHVEAFESIVPPMLPAARLLVWISGVFEILGGLAMLIPKTRQIGRWGLITLLIAVFPANIYMATAQVMPAGVEIAPPAWALWARLPLQLALIAVVWWAGAPQHERAASIKR